MDWQLNQALNRLRSIGTGLECLISFTTDIFCLTIYFSVLCQHSKSHTPFAPCVVLHLGQEEMLILHWHQKSTTKKGRLRDNIIQCTADIHSKIKFISTLICTVLKHYLEVTIIVCSDRWSKLSGCNAITHNHPPTLNKTEKLKFPRKVKVTNQKWCIKHDNSGFICCSVCVIPHLY